MSQGDQFPGENGEAARAPGADPHGAFHKQQEKSFAPAALAKEIGRAATPVRATVDGIALGRSNGGQSVLTFDGERFIPGAGSSEMALEHFHRYLLAAPLAAGKTVLDIASGDGYGSHVLAQRAHEVIGVDISPDAVAQAQASYRRDNLRFLVGSCASIPLPSQSVDMIVSFETLEHIQEHELFLEEIARVLRPSGILMISTPDKGVYNSELSEPNHHHVRELYRGEFQILLSQRFKTVNMVGQRVVFGSLALPDKSNDRFTIAQADRESQRVLSTSFAEQAVYWIAVCGNGPVPPVAGDLYGGDLPPNAVSSLLGGIAERDQKIRDLMAEMGSSAVKAGARGNAEGSKAAQDHLRAAEATIGAMRRVILERDSRLAALDVVQATFENVRTEAKLYAERYNFARKELLHREEQLELATAERDKAGAALSKMTDHLHARESELAERLSKTTNDLHARESELAELSEQLERTREKLSVRESQVARLSKNILSGAATDWRTIRALRKTAGLRLAIAGLGHLRLLRGEGGVDTLYYLTRYPDVRTLNQDPVAHYLLYGAQEGRDPSAAFSTTAYLKRNADVAASGGNPLLHYLQYGRAEGRSATRAPSLTSSASARAVKAPAEMEPAVDVAPAQVRRFAPRAPDLAGWPIPTSAERRPRRRPAQDRYSIQPDEPVMEEAAQGEAFLSRYGLLGHQPDFAGAIDAINALPAKLINDANAPDVSIVVPVYGQLAYTLNCLHSLLSHKSRYSVEIILVDDCSPDQTNDFAPRVKKVRYSRQSANGGFVKSCNAGAKLGQGQYVVMLNNDTRVAEGWLDELIYTFKTFSDAGLVGSKLFYPDGSLQEAGGIIWQDGSAWNYGRNDDPARPEYCYARPVDYVSGASIALPMALWRELGGFDEMFCPAYCEDSDLALRVRHQAGRNIYLQPISRAIHYEGKTSGTDLASGAKAYQVINSRKLYARWKHVLQSHRPNAEKPYLEKDRGISKRALFIDVSTPTPDQDAGSITAFLTMALLVRDGYKVTFIPQDNLLYQHPYGEDLCRIGVECRAVPFDYSTAEHLKEHGAEYDLVILCRMTVAEKALDLVRKHAPRAPAILHAMDLHHVRQLREAAIMNDPAIRTTALAVKNAELELIQNCDCTIVPSTFELEKLNAELPKATVMHSPYVIDCPGSTIAFEQRRDFLFLGGYRHSPNVDAVEYFIREIWPGLRNKTPGAKFYAVGSHPPEQLLALQSDEIIFTGQVDDLQPWFDRARVFVAPIRFGAGVKGKISSAMAHALPIVGTPIAFEGMEHFTPGKHGLIAESPAAFIEAACQLYNDRDAWLRLSKDSFDYCRENNSLAKGYETLTQAIEAARHTRRKT